MLLKALEMGVCFHRDSILGNMGDAPFPGPVREVCFFNRENFC
jgi:hypothetical protein